MKISLSGFLFEENYRETIPFRQFCQIARTCGYDGVELRRSQIKPDDSTEKKKEIKDILTEMLLPVTCLTARGIPQDPNQKTDFMKRYFELCAFLDCHLLKASDHDFDWLRSMASEAEKYDITLAVNNHINSMLETVDGTKEFFEAVNHSNYKLLFDAYHLSLRRQNYIDAIPEFFAKTENILMHSLKPTLNRNSPHLRYQGHCYDLSLPDDQECIQHWHSILKTFQQLGYHGYVTVIENGWPQEKRHEVAQKYINFIRTIAA